MTWRDLVPLAIVIVGIVLFLYGSNYYDAMIGWVGVALVLGGVILEMVLRIYAFMRKREAHKFTVTEKKD